MVNNLSKNYNAIDLFKFIGSIMIFVMHSMVLKDISADLTFAWELLTRWAVPFFFIASSFFLFLNKNDNLGYACKKYIKRSLLLYLVWFIINIPNIFELRLYGKNLFSISTWLIFLKNTILSSTFTGSWFFVSCIFSCILVVYLCRHLSTKTILVLTGFLQLVCIFSSVWRGVLPTAVSEKLSFLCFPLNITSGCFYFAIGKFFAEKKDYIQSVSIGKSVLMLGVSCFLYVTEVLVAIKAGFYHSSDQSFFVVPFGISAFITALNLNCNIQKGNAEKLRKASTIIFCAQGNLLTIKRIINPLINNAILDFKYTNTVSFGIVSVLMVLVVCLVFRLQTRKIKISRYLT